MVDVVLHGPHDDVAVGAEDVGEQQLVAVPVGVDRLVEGDLGLAARNFADVHQDLVLDAARGIGRELDVPVGAERADGLDQANRADGDEVLDVDAGVFKAPRDVDHETQIALDERLTRLFVTLGEAGDQRALLLGRQRRRENVAPADVENFFGPYQPQKHQKLFQIHTTPPIKASNSPVCETGVGEKATNFGSDLPLFPVTLQRTASSRPEAVPTAR